MASDDFLDRYAFARATIDEARAAAQRVERPIKTDLSVMVADIEQEMKTALLRACDSATRQAGRVRNIGSQLAARTPEPNGGDTDG